MVKIKLGHSKVALILIGSRFNITFRTIKKTQVIGDTVEKANKTSPLVATIELGSVESIDVLIELLERAKYLRSTGVL